VLKLSRFQSALVSPLLSTWVSMRGMSSSGEDSGAFLRRHMPAVNSSDSGRLLLLGARVQRTVAHGCAGHRRKLRLWSPALVLLRTTHASAPCMNR
jgi:hypothetical protein